MHFPVLQDPKTWDPGLLDLEVDSELMQNVFDNLWRFDDKLNTIPDIAVDVPSTSNGEISSDGMTVTVKRRGETWEAVTMSPNHVACADCVARVARYTAVLRTEYALADEVVKTKK